MSLVLGFTCTGVAWPQAPGSESAGPSSEAGGSDVAALSAEEAFIAAAGDAHLWFTAPAPRSPNHIELRHHPVAPEPLHYRPLRVITTRPTHVAAGDNHIWLVMPRNDDEIASQRDRRVLSMQAVQSPGFDLYIPEPRDRMRIEKTLPGWGRLVDFAGTVDGPVALLVNDAPGAPSDAQSPNPDSTASPTEGTAQPPVELLQLREGRWRSIALPADLPDTRRFRLVTSGLGGTTISLLVSEVHSDANPNAQSITHVYRRISEGVWQHATIPLELDRVVSITRTGAHAVLALAIGAKADSTVPPGQGGSLSGRSMHTDPARVRLVYLHHDQLLDLTSIGCPSTGVWQLIGTGDALLLMHAYTRAGDADTDASPFVVRARRINTLRGSFGDWQQFSQQPTPVGRLWFAGFVVTFVIMALVLLLLITPARRVATTLPADLAPLPVVPRVGALVVDLLPAGAIAKLITHGEWSDLVRIPLFASDFEQAAPFLIMVGLALTHSTLSECLWRTSLGKRLVGARVAGIDGGRPNVRQMLVRNLLKLIVLLVPPLAVFALFNRDLQLPGDVVTRTVVVRPVHGEQAE